MFTNKGKTPDPLPAVPETPGRRAAPGRLMTSIIANGVRIKGSIEADAAELQVDGEIEGNLRGGSLTIGDTGFVRGDIVSESVTVNGRIEGSLRARKVTLARTAHVMGDITHQQLSVEMGAVFEGQCRYVQDPLKSDASGAPALTGPAHGHQPAMVAQAVDAEPADHALGGVVVSEAR
jgi:cytoskeletal protein CcmA (bactofilin family)